VSISPPELRAALVLAQRHGAVGPGSLEVAVAHALDFFGGLEPVGEWQVVDLGSGGGLPGLPLALAHPQTRWMLVDAWQSRTDALQRAVVALGLDARVEVCHARAEDLGHSNHRARADVVVARSFGPPAMTAECAAPLLVVGGRLVVSAREDEPGWPSDGIDALRLRATGEWRTPRGQFRAYTLEAPVPERFPRRPAAQRRSPLF
jgi:16S rRNA (guanine527-N7)-methyltransferase